MTKLSQTMKMISGSTTYQIPFYTTTGEASAYGDYGSANVGSTACYYPLGTGADAAHGSSVKTPLKVVKSNTTYYMLTKGNGELSTYTLTLAGTSNQTITLKYKNRNYTDSGYESEVTKTSTGSNQSFTVRKGTTWTATIAAASGYKAGALSASSGTVNGNTTVSAGAATSSNAVKITFIYGSEAAKTYAYMQYTNESGQRITVDHPDYIWCKKGTDFFVHAKNSLHYPNYLAIYDANDNLLFGEIRGTSYISNTMDTDTTFKIKLV